MATLITTLQESLRYRGGTGHWAYQFHRLAGLGTLLFLLVHVLDTSTVFFFPNLYEHAINLYRSPLFMLGEIALVAAVIYHGLNGLKIVVFDIKPELWSEARERTWSWAAYVGAFLLWLPAAFLMGRALYENSLCANCVAAEGPVTQRGPLAVNVVILVMLALATLFALYLVLGALGGKGGVPKTFDTRMWQFMRWSGVLLIPLAYGHVLIKDVIHGVHSIDLNYVELYWSTVSWRIYDAALLGLAMAHGMNGLRQVAEDYIHGASLLRIIKWAMLVVWIVITAIGAIALVGGVRNI
ncbi:MAG: hypothetical protein ACE5FI_11090 [Anaerolineales bacterium]